MKRIIDGKTYDTATSKKIGRWTDVDREEQISEEQILYKTAGGAFFLHEHKQWQEKGYYEEGEWFTKQNDILTPMTQKQAEKWMLEGKTEVLSDEFVVPSEARVEEEPKKMTAKV